MNNDGKAVVIHNCSNGEDFIWLSEAAETRLCRIMTGLMILMTMPVFVGVFLV